MKRIGLFLCLVLVGCGDDAPADPDPTDNADGQALYEQPHEDGNTFACATCHALEEPAADGYTRPGHPIGDAALRESYKNGQLSTFLEAVNTCRTEWLNTTPFEESDPRWTDLKEYLTSEAESRNPDPEPLTFEIVDPPSDIDGGDHVVGEDTFNGRCIVCHGSSGVGTERAPAIAGTMLPGDFIALKVRRSGDPNSTIYDTETPGAMPFWSADRISDDQLRDVIAFLAMSEPPEVPMDNTGGERIDLSQDGAQSDCGSTNAKVGQTLTFNTISHQVAGTATIVDDCTIQLDDFSFDGGGIDVHLLGGTDNTYSSPVGIDLSINMVGTAFDGGSAEVRLPTGVTLDQFDGLSVWCVPVGFDFGSGQFM